jgi:hypothetical protein
MVRTVSGKRDQISGTIAHYERLLREAEHDLAQIGASLRLFEGYDRSGATMSGLMTSRKPRPMGLLANPNDQGAIFSIFDSGSQSLVI